MTDAPAQAPLVSVVIPVYNQGEFLAAAIDSVLTQDYRPLELIVVDDGSTDLTAAVIERYGGSIVAIHQDNRGAARALNEGIGRSRGELICWLSADDEFLPGKLTAQARLLELRPSVGMTYTGYDVVDALGRTLRHIPHPRLRDPDPFVAVFWENPINGSTVMLRRTTFTGVGPFDTELRADVDAEMWMRIALVTNIAAVDGAYLRYRVHGASLSADKPLMRQSMTQVRLARLADGSLVRRLGQRDARRAPRILARMAAEYAWRGLPELATALRRASRTAGSAPPEQAFALGIMAATRWRAGHRVAIRVGARIRRWLWRLKEQHAVGR